MAGGHSRTRQRTSLCTSFSVASWIFFEILSTFELVFCGGAPGTARQHMVKSPPQQPRSASTQIKRSPSGSYQSLTTVSGQSRSVEQRD